MAAQEVHEALVVGLGHVEQADDLLDDDDDDDDYEDYDDPIVTTA